MYKYFAFFKTIDEKIFSFITEFKQTEHYSNFSQKITSLDENYQKLIRNSIFYGLLALPVIVTLIMISSIYNNYSSIGYKKEMLELIDHQMVILKQVEQFSNGLISNEGITSEEDLKNSIVAQPNLSGLAQKLVFENFTQSPIAGNFNASQLTIKFTDISTPDLASLINFLFENYKARILSSNIERNNQRKLLFGEINLHILSR